MNHDTEHARYIPLTHPGQENAVLLLDSHASLRDLRTPSPKPASASPPASSTHSPT